MIFLDSNIFVYAAGAEHPLKAPCVELLERAAQGHLDATTSAEVVQEIHRVFSRRHRRADGIQLGQEVVRLFPDLLPITKNDVLRSGQLLTATPQLSPRDALHAATAMNNGIFVIASADKDFDLIEDIRRLDPV